VSTSPPDLAPEPVQPSGGPWAAPVIALLFRMLSWTWRVHRHDYGRYEPELRTGKGVLAFWHGEQLAFIGCHRHLPVAGMASVSKDGELLARVITRLGYSTVRGSSSRRGKEAYRGALEAIASGRIPALAVDGPRGPRHQPQIGASALAASSQVGVCWVISRSRPCLRLRSWDRFEIPLPFARVDLFYGWQEPAPDSEDRSRVEQERRRLGEAMREAWQRVRGEPAALSPSEPTRP